MSDYFNLDSVTHKFDDDIFASLVGGVYDFYGVDGTCFCIGVNGTRMVLEAVENPDDGYRSFLACFRTPEVGKIFFGTPVATVRLLAGGLSSRTTCFCATCEAGEAVPTAESKVCSSLLEERRKNFVGWVLQDVDSGHTWLTVGTDHGDDYYPCFTFDYTPDTTQILRQEDR